MDLFLSDFVRWCFIAWFAFLGGAVGSFLNVVVYRWPRGLNIAWPPSHCPSCQHPIRWYDNVPVLAWLWLRGRCRDCRCHISIRYPLVETVSAALCVLLLIVEGFHNAHNLPPRNPPPTYSLSSYSPPQALALCLFHLGLLATLLAAALMAFDGNRPPRKLFVPMLLVGLLAPLFCPWLHPWAAAAFAAEHFWGGAFDSLCGLAVGYCLGFVAPWLARWTAGAGRGGYCIGGESVLIGVILGWQAAIVLVAAGTILETLTRLAGLRWPRLRFATAAVWLPPLALLWIVNWAALAKG